MIKVFGARGVASAGAIALVTSVFASGGVLAAGENLTEIFTDANFRGCVVSALQTEVNPMITETSVVSEENLGLLTQLSCNDNSLTAASLAGLENLTGLTTLDVADNQINDIDLSANVALTRLVLANNLLTDLDLTNNVALTYLDIHGNTGLGVEAVDVSTTKLNTLTDEDGIWEYVEESETGENTTEETTEDVIEDTAETCSSWEIDDETIAIFKGILAAYGYNTSNYDATAVRLAAAQTNMCDGMDIAEARTLMNAMGVTDLSDEELARIAEMVTSAYNAINNGASLEDLLSMTTSEAPLVPNTGVNTGEFNASMVMLSIGGVVSLAGVAYVAYYGIRRKEARVNFKR